MTQITHYLTNGFSITDRGLVAIIYGEQKKIREIGSADVSLLILNHLHNLAATYCGSIKNTEDFAWVGMVAMVQTRFSHLKALEISTAFQLAASHVLPVNLTTYSQIFSATMLGDVLSAYCVYRADLVAKTNKLIEANTPKEKAVDPHLVALKNDKVAALNFWNNCILSAKIGSPKFKSRELFMPTIFDLLVSHKILAISNEQKIECYRNAILELRIELIRLINKNKMVPTIDSQIALNEAGVLPLLDAAFCSKMPQNEKEERQMQIALLEDYINSDSKGRIGDDYLHRKIMDNVAKIFVWDGFLSPQIYEKKRADFFEAWQVLGDGDLNFTILADFMQTDGILAHDYLIGLGE